RHPHDRYAELRPRRGAGPGNLDDRRLSQEAAERIGGGLQGVVRETLRARGCPFSDRYPNRTSDGVAADRRQAISTISACDCATLTVSPSSFPNSARAKG